MRGLVAIVALVAGAACTPAQPPNAPSQPPPPPPPDATPPPPPDAPAPVAAPAKMQVHLIDVGQGAATLIELSCAAVLIDTGGETNKDFDSTAHLTAYLDEFFKRRRDLQDRIALLVITHPHIDHARGAKAVFERYTVQNVVTNGMTTSSGGPQQAGLIKAAQAAGIELEAIRAADVSPGGLHDDVIDPVACADGDPDVRVLWGAVDAADVTWSAKALDNANNHSVVTKVTLGKSSLIVTGDLEDDGIAALLAKHGGTTVLDSDVYEVGHHGSHNATTAPLLEAITPKIALLGTGSTVRRDLWTAWAYGHPRAVTIGLLETALAGAAPRPATTQSIASGAKKFATHTITAPIYATGWDGDVVVTMSSDGEMSVQTATPATP